jgi:hypothetical protein
MLDFQNKVGRLRTYESLCFTICFTLLAEEHSASKSAERVLCQLFADNGFWQLDENKKQSHILRICTRECMRYTDGFLVISS